MGKLENKVAIVTGASSGMGKEIAKLFAQEGASVIAIARRAEKLQEVIDQITAEGGRALAVSGDVSKEEDVRNAVRTAVEQYGRLDIVVNNAGLMDRMGGVAVVDDQLWNSIIDVNLTGPMRMMRAAIPVFLDQGGGVFVTVASIGGLHGCRAGAAYTASKHGVIGLAKNVGHMYAKKGIRSNIIAPGGVNTDITSNLQIDPEGGALCGAGLVTNPRMGEADEIARVALFLASDDSSFVNGATLVADSGWSAY
ncbi:MAG: glucose 1-dehydrogenase [Methanospirillum sp.]|nr:glucose 1-dehydrogenase [Methanospirillum sp.]